MWLSMSEHPGADVVVVETDRSAAPTEEVTIELEGRTATTRYREGDTLLQCARAAELRPPYSCGSCMARIVEGSARMVNNDALEDDEVEEGWVLTCQSLPISRTVRVVFD
jgi:ferredoxin